MKVFMIYLLVIVSSFYCFADKPASSIGFIAQKNNDPEMQKMALKAVKLMNTKDCSYKLIKIQQVGTLVSAGVNYQFLLTLKSPKGLETWSIVLYQHYSGKCSILRKNQIINLGGYVPQKANDKEMILKAKKAVALLGKKKAKFLKLHIAATQVVAGTNYFFLVSIQTPKGKELWQLVMYEGFSGDCSLSKQNKVK